MKMSVFIPASALSESARVFPKGFKHQPVAPADILHSTRLKALAVLTTPSCSAVKARLFEVQQRSGIRLLCARSSEKVVRLGAQEHEGRP